MRLTLLLLLLTPLSSALAQDVNAPLRGRVLSSTDGVESPLGFVSVKVLPVEKLAGGTAYPIEEGESFQGLVTVGADGVFSLDEVLVKPGIDRRLPLRIGWRYQVTITSSDHWLWELELDHSRKTKGWVREFVLQKKESGEVTDDVGYVDPDEPRRGVGMVRRGT